MNSTPQSEGKALREQLIALCERYQLIAVYAFGSRAEEVVSRLEGKGGDTCSSSDVDIGVLPSRERSLSARDRVQLMLDLEDLFDVPRVDLVILSEAPPFLALDVVRGPLLYATDTVAEAEYQLYVLRRAGDLAPFERQRLQMIMDGEAF